jgi:hypothetical protein
VARPAAGLHPAPLVPPITARSRSSSPLGHADTTTTGAAQLQARAQPLPSSDKRGQQRAPKASSASARAPVLQQEQQREQGQLAGPCEPNDVRARGPSEEEERQLWAEGDGLQSALASHQPELERRLAAVSALAERRHALAGQVAAAQQLCLHAQQVEEARQAEVENLGAY